MTSNGRPRVLALAIVSLSLALGPAFATPQATQADHWVLNAPPGALLHPDVQLIDDYGAFVTARLTPEAARRLTESGADVIPLNHSVGRGSRLVWPEPGNRPPAGLPGPEESSLWIVQFRGPVKAAWRAALEEVAWVYDYLPHDAFLAKPRPGGRELLASLPGVRAILPYGSAFKISTDLPRNGPVDATVLALPQASPETLGQRLDHLGAVVRGSLRTNLDTVVDVTLDASRLDELAKLDDVVWIEPAYDEGSLDNEQASAIVQSGEVAAWRLHDHGVDGGSQKVSVCDTGVNTNFVGTSTQPPTAGVLKMAHEMHDDEAGVGLVPYNAQLLPATGLPPPHRKVDLYYSPQEDGNRGDDRDADGHGTHTAGTLAGDAPPYGVRNGNDGVAYAARLLVCDISIGTSVQILNDYSRYWEPAFEQGARVSSNSWGSTPTALYTEKARQHDAYVWEHRDFVIARSMGNGGPSGTMRPEAVAKNVLSVGATFNGAAMDTLSPTSTWGPTADGRTKPNVVAPGRCLVSSYLPGRAAYECLSGTSMSTPLVAGAAALVRDYFEKGFYPSGAPNVADAVKPSAALVRAVLQISGKEIPGDGGQAGFPNPAQGWGRIQLDEVLHFAGDGRQLLAWDEGDRMSTGDVFERTLVVPGGQPLRLMLAWTDAPGAPGAASALVNNLDLEVKGPGGPVHRGSVVDPGSAARGRPAADDTNVEEAVVILDPQPGVYRVRVLAPNVPAGPQPFALVATGSVPSQEEPSGGVVGGI